MQLLAQKLIIPQISFGADPNCIIARNQAETAISIFFILVGVIVFFLIIKSIFIVFRIRKLNKLLNITLIIFILLLFLLEFSFYIQGKSLPFPTIYQCPN